MCLLSARVQRVDRFSDFALYGPDMQVLQQTRPTIRNSFFTNSRIIMSAADSNNRIKTNIVTPCVTISVEFDATPQKSNLTAG